MIIRQTGLDARCWSVCVCTCCCTRCSGRAVQDGEGGVWSSLSRLRKHSKLNVGLLEAKKNKKQRIQKRLLQLSSRKNVKKERKKKYYLQRFNVLPPCGEGRNHLLGDRLPSGQMSCWSSSQSASGCCCCSSLEASRSKRRCASSCSCFASLRHHRGTKNFQTPNISNTSNFQVAGVTQICM